MAKQLCMQLKLLHITMSLHNTATSVINIVIVMMDVLQSQTVSLVPDYRDLSYHELPW